MNKMMSSGEAQVVRFNLDQIERELGHAVPGGLLDYSDMTKILSPGEVNHICYNIKEVERNRRMSSSHYTNHRSNSDDALLNLIKLVFGVGFLIVGLIFGFL